jgi:hypothetical protein
VLVRKIVLPAPDINNGVFGGGIPYGGVFASVIDRLPPLNLTNGPWLAGGSVRRFLEEQTTFGHNDFDIWFKNQDQYDQWNKWMLKNGEYVFDSHNAITYKVQINGGLFVKVQMIHLNFYQDAETLLNSFDFTMSQCLTDGVYLATEVYQTEQDIKNKKLTITNTITSPVSTIRRIAKFIDEGYTISNKEIAKLLAMVVDNPDSIKVIFESDTTDAQKEKISF